MPATRDAGRSAIMVVVNGRDDHAEGMAAIDRLAYEGVMARESGQRVGESRTVISALRQRRDEGGPRLWAQAFDRVIELWTPVWRNRTTGWVGAELEYGATAMALSIYLIAATGGKEVAAITREDLAPLVHHRRGSDRAVQWRRLLYQAGHAPDDRADPVSKTWRELSQDNEAKKWWQRHHPESVLASEGEYIGTPLLGEPLDQVLHLRWRDKGLQF